MIGGKGHKLMTAVIFIGIMILIIMLAHQGHLQQLQPTVQQIKDLKNQLAEKIQVSMFKSSEPAENNGNSPLDKLRRQGMIELPNKKMLGLMSTDALYQTYHSYLDNNDITCHRKLRMGKIGDGGWEICDDIDFRPGKPCLVYSFGINNDFSFDDDTANTYNCSVFSFDPSMKRESYQRSPLVYFLKMGIGASDEKMMKSWQLHSLDRFKDLLNHTGRVIDVLKMDVENAEWRSLPQIVKSGQLPMVKQLLVEYHGAHPQREELMSHLGLMKDIYNAGFRKFYVHKNPACRFKNEKFPVSRTMCYEVHYININKPVS